MDHVPSVWPIEWGELLDFCNAAGYRCRLEPAGSLLIPPDYNVGLTDWERTLRLRQGDWAVLDAEPERRPEALADEHEQQQQHSALSAFGHRGAAPDWQTLMAAARAREAAEQAASAAAPPPAGAEAANAVELTDAQLAELKQRLEALLPRD